MWCRRSSLWLCNIARFHRGPYREHTRGHWGRTLRADHDLNSFDFPFGLSAVQEARASGERAPRIMRTPFRDAACKLAVLKPAVADGAKIIQREGDAPDLLTFFSYPPEFKLEARGWPLATRVYRPGRGQW
jgi:hypothetical protein